MNSQSLSTRLAKCLKELLPSNALDVRVHDIHLIQEQGTQCDMYSFFVTYVSEGSKQQEELILRIYGENAEEMGRNEFTMLKALKKHDLPVPAVYYFGANNNGIVGRPFLIMERIAGRSASHFLNDETSAQATVNKMAESLARIHKLNPKCLHNSRVLQEQQERRQRRLLKVRFFIKRGFFVFSPPRQRRFIAAVKSLEELEPEESRLAILHRDYDPRNVLVSNGQCIVTDWIMASVGDPAIDVGWTYHVLRIGSEMVKVDLGEHFVKCYEKHTGQSLVNLQFGKDMAALNLASQYGLLPFNSSTFLIFLRLVDHTFGNVYGRLKGGMHAREKQRFMVSHHQPSIWSNIEYIQSYVTNYLERDR